MDRFSPRLSVQDSLIPTLMDDGAARQSDLSRDLSLAVTTVLGPVDHTDCGLDSVTVNGQFTIASGLSRLCNSKCVTHEVLGYVPDITCSEVPAIRV